MTHPEVEKYSKSVRVLHWIHSGAFVVLFLTGLMHFIPPLGFLAMDSWTRLIHRVAAAIFIIAPFIYLVLNPKSVAGVLKQTFTWGSDDIGWLRAAPRYYFLSDEKDMPPQGMMNAGQKVWWFIIIVFGIIFVISGATLWFASTKAPVEVLRWMLFAHDVSFIVTGSMFFLHLYLGVFHPLMKESWKAMTIGKISDEYAKAHHARWYEEITRGKEEKTQ